MNRVGAAEIAFKQAGGKAEGCVLASDAFFPFRDSVDEAAKHDIKAIIQPGGSIRDQESIDACNENGIAMVFTLSLIHISEPTRLHKVSRMPSSA